MTTKVDKKTIINEIKKFLDGSDENYKYLVSAEIDETSNRAFCVFHPPGGDINTEYIQYTPFMYIKDLKKNGYQLFGGDQGLLKAKMLEYGISIKKLKTGKQPRLVNGFCYKVTSTKSYNHIINFFKNGGIDPFEKKKTDRGKIIYVNDRAQYLYRHLFYSVKPIEQFFISTGIRLFKGYEDYNDIHKLTFDIETTGLRYETSRIFAIGVRDNKGFETVLTVDKENDDESEKIIIQNFFNTIDYIKPANIQGYNSEMFDFDFILGRAGILKIDLKKLKTTLSEAYGILRNPRSSVKFGNSSEKYTSTHMWGYNIIDILHAVKRTAAINTEIKNNKLKYICKFEDIAKENRMYIEGSDIGKYWHENKSFIINPINNEYIQIPDLHQKDGMDLLLLQFLKQKNKIDDKNYSLEKKKILIGNKELLHWLKEQKQIYGEYKFISGKEILNKYLLDDLWETEAVDGLYNQSTFLLAKSIPTNFSRIATMGNAAVWNLLMTTWSYENDLAIPAPDISENFGGGLVRCYKKGYFKRVVKIDFASLYPMIQLTWDVFPMFDITGVIKKMLIYMTTTRNIYKKLANYDEISDDEIMLLNELDHETYIKYINNDIKDSERSKYKTKQLPIKILNNSLFGALGSGVAFNWSDNVCASRITSTGRIQLRKAIAYFKKFGLVPLLAVTDGVNFGIPDKTNIRVTKNGTVNEDIEDLIENMWQYNNKVGVAALIEKFNTEEMPEYQSVDNDGEFISCYNLSRINYALLMEKKNKKTGKTKEVVKLTGNTIKSKTMPEYIEDFINSGFELIMKGKGAEFVKFYNDYSEDLYYKRIPLKKIASKSKVKTSITNYMNRGVDINGREKGKQAHMELLIMERDKIAREIFEERKTQLLSPENINKDYSLLEIRNIVKDYMPPEPELDTMVYFINTGYKKSHGNSSWIKDEKNPELMRYASSLINNDDLINNPNMMGDYNVDKYFSAFNSRVEVLLHGFNEEIRDKILNQIKTTKEKNSNGTNIENRTLVKNYFTNDELSLSSYDFDDFEESMYLESKEVKFWNRYGYDPYLIWDGFKVSEKTPLSNEIYKFKLNYVGDLMEKSGKPRPKSISDQLFKGDFVLLKNNKIYSLGYHNGEHIEIIREELVDLPKCELEIEMDKNEQIEINLIKQQKTDAENIIKENEYNKLFSDRKKITNYFEKFKDIHSLPEDTKMESFFELIPTAKEIFDEYVMSMETVVDENVDEGDFY